MPTAPYTALHRRSAGRLSNGPTAAATFGGFAVISVSLVALGVLTASADHTKAGAVLSANAVESANAVVADDTCANGFPADFVWGLGTAAYQIEGGWNATNRSPSIWDVFSHTKGAVAGGDTGDLADDVIHRWRDDIALMSELGLKHYRFSLSWSRMMSWDGERQLWT